MNETVVLRALRGATTAEANTAEAIGWDQVALLDCQQMAVAGDLPRCIRLLAHAWLRPEQEPVHPYLRDAARLRPDRAHP